MKKKCHVKGTHTTSRRGIKILIAIIGIVLIVVAGILIYLHAQGSKKENEEMGTEQQLEKETEGYSGWASYNVKGQVHLSDYNDMNIEIPLPDTVSEEDLERYVDQILKNYPEYVRSKAQIVEKGAFVFADIEGVLEGETEAVVSDKDIVIEVGSGKMVSAIDEALPGKKAGDKFEVSYQYPEDFKDEAYRGKIINFSVRVEGIYDIKYYTYEELTEDFARNTLQCRSVDSFLSQIKNEMYDIISEQESSLIEEKIVESVLERSNVNLPDQLYNEKYEQQKLQFINFVCNGDESQYVTMLKQYTGMTDDEYRENLMEDIKKTTDFEVIAEELAKELKISASGDEYDEFVSKQMSSENITDIEQYYDLLTTKYETGKDYLTHKYYMNAIIAYFTGKSTVTHAKDAMVATYMFGE